MEFEQILFSQSKRLEIDKAGRIRLPESLLDFAGIKSQAVVIGVRDHLEIRDPDQWKTRNSQNCRKFLHEREAESVLARGETMNNLFFMAKHGRLVRKEFDVMDDVSSLDLTSAIRSMIAISGPRTVLGECARKEAKH